MIMSIKTHTPHARCGCVHCTHTPGKYSINFDYFNKTNLKFKITKLSVSRKDKSGQVVVWPETLYTLKTRRRSEKLSYRV